MQLLFFALFASACLCTSVVVLPQSFAQKEMETKEMETIASVARYCTSASPLEGFDAIAQTDSAFRSAFDKKQKSLIVVVEQSEKETFSSLEQRFRLSLKDSYSKKDVSVAQRLASFLGINENQTNFVAFDANKGKGTKAQIVSEKDGKFGAVSFETVAKYFSFDNEGKVVVGEQVFDKQDKLDLQFLYELTYLYEIAAKNIELPTFTAIVVSAHNKFTDKKREVALKEINDAISKILSEIEKEIPVQVLLLGDYQLEKVSKRDDAATSHRNYTGIAWISIFSVLFIICCMLLGSWLMVDVGDDCAKDTLLARAF